MSKAEPYSADELEAIKKQIGFQAEFGTKLSEPVTAKRFLATVAERDAVIGLYEGFVRHDNVCDIPYLGQTKCSCGFDNLIAEIARMKEGR